MRKRCPASAKEEGIFVAWDEDYYPMSFMTYGRWTDTRAAQDGDGGGGHAAAPFRTKGRGSVASRERERVRIIKGKARAAEGGDGVDGARANGRRGGGEGGLRSGVGYVRSRNRDKRMRDPRDAHKLGGYVRARRPSSPWRTRPPRAAPPCARAAYRGASSR